MIRFSPIRDREEVCRLNKSEQTNAGFAYGIYQTDKLIGWALYDISSTEGVFLAVNAPDLLLAEGIVRAVFGNLFYDLHIDSVRFDKKIHRELLNVFGEKVAESREILSISDVLHGCSK